MPAGAEVRIEAKISSEMPLPIPRFVISSPIHISSVVPAVSVMMISTRRPVSMLQARPGAGRGTRTRRLRGRERDGEVARVLGDLRVARLALALERLELGTTTVSSCIMIDAVTYGMIPSAKIEKRESAEPLKRLSRPSTPPCR